MYTSYKTEILDEDLLLSLDACRQPIHQRKRKVRIADFGSKQKNVAALDLPLFPMRVNTFVEFFEKETLQQVKDEHRLWVDYVYRGHLYHLPAWI